MPGFAVDDPPLTDEKRMPDIVEGDQVDFDINFQDEDGNAIGIDGWEVWITVKDNYTDDDASALIQTSTTSHDDPTGGVTSLSFPSSDTQDLSGTKVWDLQVLTSAGNSRTVVRGTVTFVPEVTRA